MDKAGVTSLRDEVARPHHLGAETGHRWDPVLPDRFDVTRPGLLRAGVDDVSVPDVVRHNRTSQHLVRAVPGGGERQAPEDQDAVGGNDGSG